MRVIGYTAATAMNGATFEVRLGRERNKLEEAKLKCFITYHFAELPLNHIEIFSTFGKLQRLAMHKIVFSENMDGNCTKLEVRGE